MHTKETIIEQLKAMGAPQNSVVLMHTSLRAIGPVEGGAEALLDALIEYFTAEGGLFCVPTHTWHNLDKEITLDICSEDTCLGAFSSVAIRDGRGIRSESPTHSMVVFGNRETAEAFIAQEPFCKTPTASESGYGKLFAMGGYVLLVGVGQDKNTYIHAVEELLDVPNRMGTKPIPVAVKHYDGQVEKREIFLYEADFTEDVSWQFGKFEVPFRCCGCITDGFIGNAPAQLCDARKMKETIERIYQNAAGEDVLKGEQPIPQAYYCDR